MAKKQAIKNIQSNTQITIYETDDGKARVEVRFEDENVWLTQTQMSELFDRDQSVISKHIKNVFDEGELDEKSNMQNLHTAISDKPVVLYSLDVIISVGYRVNSDRGTLFRQWAKDLIVLANPWEQRFLGSDFWAFELGFDFLGGFGQKRLKKSGDLLDLINSVS